MVAQTVKPAEPVSWVAQHQLVSFFVLTYAVNIAATLALGFVTGLLADLLMFLRIFSPTLSAVALTFALGGAESVKALLLRLVRWNVGAVWYVAALALFWIPLLFALVYDAFGLPSPGLRPDATPLLLLGQVFVTLYSGPLVEETGWRGFALPRLQERFGALTSSLILGVIWACWHLPFYATSGGGAGIPFPAYLALVTVVTVYITWIYNNTRGSLLLCILTHFSFNAASAFLVLHLGLLPQMVFNIACSVSLLAVVVAIVWRYGPGAWSASRAQMPLRSRSARAHRSRA